MLCHQPSGTMMKRNLLYLRLKAAHALQPVCYLAVTAMVSSRVLWAPRWRSCALCRAFILFYTAVNHGWVKRRVPGRFERTCSFVVMVSHSAMSCGIISACLLRFSNSWENKFRHQKPINNWVHDFYQCVICYEHKANFTNVK